MIKLAISGCCGKMGARILNFALEDKNFQVTCLLERKGHDSIGKKSAGLEITDDIEKIRDSDILIEFTSPESTVIHLEVCVKNGKAIVIGTTGLSEEQLGIIKLASEKIAVVFSPNMSVGVNLLFSLLKEASRKLSNDYKVAITEAHHVHKKDAPSGTAKKLAQIIKDNGSQKVGDIKSIREGEITGDHDICFESQEDIIRLSHSAKTRDIFAKGSLVAAKFVSEKKSGLFDMQNVLNKKFS
ncbi:4-hydroxy-tetrahydrodipicolinate reductase [Thermoproteota archaeon]